MKMQVAEKTGKTTESCRNRASVRLIGVILSVFLISSLMLAGTPSGAGNNYKVLPPITHGDLSIFPVVSSHGHDAGALMTLDEGVRSGEVVVTEAGDERGLVRHGQIVPRRRGAEVNRLVLYNNSNRPLLLLAGEIVTGGKQDRVIGADRIVPPKAGPIDLGVFCVEPGRWVASSEKFGSMQAQMAQPSVRTPAMAAKSQDKVWENVSVANRNMVASAPSAAQSVGGVTSYAKVFESAPVKATLGDYGDEQTILRELRSKGAVGIVIAVRGRTIWADVFASNDLLVKYWPKLFKSYVAEAITSAQGNSITPDIRAAQIFIESLSGGREVIETEPGIYRRSEISGNGYRVFQLASLLPKSEFDVHITKMKE